MSAALQVILFLASLAFIVLVGCIIFIAFQVLRQLQHLVLTVEQLKANMQVLLEDSRELVRNVNELAKRANQQMDDMGKVVRTVQQWTERGDRLVNEVGSAIEPPVFSLVQNLNLLRAAVTTFLKVLLHPHQYKQTKKEKEHV
jgi:uncharacterized protein YoxC